MKLRYEPLVRTGDHYRLTAIATSRGGASKLLIASGDSLHRARNNVDARVDEIPAEWWQE